MTRPASISCPVTDDQLTQIDTLITRTGQTRSEWLQDLVQAALRQDHISPAPSIDPPIIDPPMEDEPDEILHDFLAPEPVSARQPQGLEQGLGQAPASQPLSFPKNMYEAEDEPDEVLYDFLASKPLSERSPRDSQQAPGQSPTSQLSSSPQNMYEAEDEPDEILYDFLDETERPF
ncbi:MAG: hypothetical protein F6K30_19615 [Cyanothece sp. SIO2G6]|nr:hypothetical protein [Cyanothece sp. SIO2G6]